MRYKIFGRRTGLRVLSSHWVPATSARVGVMSPSGRKRKKFSMLTPKPAATSSIRRNRHQFGQSEELVSEFIAADRDSFVLATKCTLETTATNGISGTGNSRKNMVRSVEGNLKRLKTLEAEPLHEIRAVQWTRRSTRHASPATSHT